MKVIAGLHRLRHAARPAVVTIGNYDGVHLGHQAMLRALKKSAQDQAAISSVIIFEPTPLEVMRPTHAPRRITSLRDKLQRLQKMGIEQVVVLNFRDVADMSPEDFVQQVLVDGLQTKVIRIGDDFRFGKDRAGDFDSLVQLGAQHQFTVERLESHRVAGKRVSSTAIRAALHTGELKQAGDLLGYRYQISGKVAHGDKLGRTLDFPTANLQFRFPLALQGVYLVQVHCAAWETDKFGVANAGSRPTVNGKSHRLEVHLLDFSGDLYGKRLTVTPLIFIRGEQSFESLDALKAQIGCDVATAKALLKPT